MKDRVEQLVNQISHAAQQMNHFEDIYLNREFINFSNIMKSGAHWWLKKDDATYCKADIEIVRSYYEPIRDSFKEDMRNMIDEVLDLFNAYIVMETLAPTKWKSLEFPGGSSLQITGDVLKITLKK